MDAVLGTEISFYETAWSFFESS